MWMICLQRHLRPQRPPLEQRRVPIRVIKEPMETTNKKLSPESGFTLVETAIALVVMMVGALAISSLFLFSIQNNVGGGERAQSMAVAQQQMEQLRSVKFDDSTLAVGSTTLPSIISGGRTYTVVRTIEEETNPDASTKSLKKITLSVTPNNAANAWQRSRVVLVSQRSTMAIGAYAVQ
jgi:Tfp pilus assembly protein PilV